MAGPGRKGTSPGYFYYLEEKGRREENLARKQTELATWFNNRIPVLCGPELPFIVPSREIQARLGAGNWEAYPLSFPTPTPPAQSPSSGLLLPWTSDWPGGEAAGSFPRPREGGGPQTWRPHLPPRRQDCVGRESRRFTPALSPLTHMPSHTHTHIHTLRDTQHTLTHLPSCTLTRSYIHTHIHARPSAVGPGWVGEGPSGRMACLVAAKGWVGRSLGPGRQPKSRGWC